MDCNLTTSSVGYFFYKRDVRPFRYKDSLKIKEKINKLERIAKSKNNDTKSKNNDNNKGDIKGSKHYKRLKSLDFNDSRFLKNNNLGVFAGIFASKTITIFAGFSNYKIHLPKQEQPV